MRTLLWLLVSAGAAAAQDWPEFRGPTAQGHSGEVGLPSEWSPTKNVAWKEPLPGHGWSSPAIVRGRIYLTAAVPVEGSRNLLLTALCLEAKTGKALWQREVFRQDGATAPPIHKRNSHASPTPIVDGGRIFVHFGLHGTACLDLEGQVLWRFESPRFDHEDGNGGSPLLVDDALIFNCDGKDLQFVLALDRATGKLLWKTERRTKAKFGYSYATPLLLTVQGRKQVINPASGAVCSYDPATGREIWRVDYGTGGFSVVPRPVAGHGLIYICTGFEKPRLLAVRPDGQGDVTATHVAWSTERAVPLVASLLLAGDELYMVSDRGIATCLDARTGKEHWQERICDQAWASPLLADGKVYFHDVKGLSVVLRPGPKFQLLASNALGEALLASAAVSDRALFIRTEKHLWRIQETR